MAENVLRRANVRLLPGDEKTAERMPQVVESESLSGFPLILAKVLLLHARRIRRQMLYPTEIRARSLIGIGKFFLG
jgi:hypothetical protein